jgi:serine/threonine protein kinase/tetratricopeptide (TPR) repeat protein
MLSHLRNELRTIGRYRVLERLGRGGMGEVYLAEDPTLRRRVAIKLLAEEVARDPERRHRFVREAVAASALTHPHVAAVYEAGETDEGEAYICMEYVAGETLAARLARERLSIDDAVRISREIADALDEAYRRGIVHRDIKPANVMIDDRGRVKVVDFGIAKIAEPVSTNLTTATQETAAGAVMGTLQYMSPEQASGGRVDHRSDLFSLGVVMYEMITGRRPGTSVEAPDCPRPLARIVMKCLEKERERRYQTARELLADLDAMGGRSRAPLVAVAVIAVLAIAAVAWMLIRSTPPKASIQAPRAPNRSVAVLPFVNMSADASNAFIADGMTEEVINALAQVPSLHVVSRTSSFAFKGQNADIRTIGNKLGVASVVEGSVQRAGDRLRVTAQLIHVDDGYHLWSERYDRNVDDVFAVQDEIAHAVASALRARIAGAAVAQPPTHDLIAYEAYVKARQSAGIWTRSTFDRALAYYQQAIDRDPSFAAAYAGRAEVYSLLDHRAGLTSQPTSETYRLAIEAAQKALSIDSDSAEAHGALGHIYMHQGRFADADAQLQRSLMLNPNAATSHLWLGVLRRAQHRDADAIAETSTALQLDPLNELILNVGATNFTLCGQLERAAAIARRGLQADREYGDLYLTLARAEMMQGYFDKARQALDDAARATEPPASVEETRALLLAFEGRHDEALSDLRRIEREKKNPAPEVMLRGYAAAGDTDDALRWVEKLMRERPNYARLSLDLGSDPAFAAIRKDPRFVSFRHQLGLPD